MPRIPGDIVKRATDANNNPVSGARLFVYEAGTTIPVTTYSDAGLTTPHAFPVIADSSGVFPPVYVASTTIKVNMTSSTGSALPGYPVDNLAGILAQSEGGTGAASLGAATVTATGGDADSLADHLGDFNRRAGVGFASVAAAALRNIDTSLSRVEVDGVLFTKTATTYRLGNAAGGDQFTSADGAKWVRADLIETNMRQPIVLLIAGQSNAIGASSGNGGVIDSEPGVWSFERFTSGDQTQGWKTGFKKSPDFITGQVGNFFGYHFAMRLHRETKRPVVILFDALGGRDVAEWLPGGGGLSGATGEMWTRLSQVRSGAFSTPLPFRTDGATLDDLGLTTADYFLWHQGEGNADSAALYSSRQGENFKRDLHRMLATFLDPASAGSAETPLIRADTRVVVGELWPGASGDRNAELRQVAAEVENVGLARLTDLPAADSLHFDPEQHERMADRYYDGLRANEPKGWDVTIPDDGLYEWRPSHPAGQYAVVSTNGTSEIHVSFGFRVVSTGQITPMWSGLSFVASLQDTDLSASLATSADGVLTISAIESRLQIRNRRGASLTLRIIPQTPQPIPGYLSTVA